jgi:hypothetical protein
MFLVGEQVNVLGWPRRQAVGLQGIAAECEPVSGCCGQRDRRDLAVQVADRHQPPPDERGTACSSLPGPARAGWQPQAWPPAD